MGEQNAVSFDLMKSEAILLSKRTAVVAERRGIRKGEQLLQFNNKPSAGWAYGWTLNSH